VSVTAPAGFRAAGVAAGLKASGEPDVALVVNDGPADAAAGVFTRNRVAAAPVLWSRQVLAAGRLRAVLLNSGCANAATGPAGFADTHASAERVAGRLGVGAAEVAVCSTGLIGQRLALPVLLAGIDRAAGALSTSGADDAARAIMTTDTRPKQAVHSAAGYSIGGMAKGAGMLAPALATMLVVLTTDAVVDVDQLEPALRVACDRTFERLDVDGCLSTNDTVLLLASGASGRRPDAAEFRAGLTELCAGLAAQLLADAEGATHEIAVRVVGAATEEEALNVGRAVARSNLFKCAVYGGDPNWGRVVAAVGTTDACFDPADLAVTINGVPVCVGCSPAEPADRVDLSARQVEVVVGLGAGDREATVWTTDLTPGYVHENSAYST